MEDDVWCVPVLLTIVKRIEQVLIDNQCPYWTNGSFSDAQISEYKARKSKLDENKMLVNLSDFNSWITAHGMKQAIMTELSDILSKVDLQVWLENNKVRTSQIVVDP